MMTEIRIVVTSLEGKRCGLTVKRHKVTFYADRNVPYFELVYGCIGVYICKKIQTIYLRSVHFTV